MKGLTMKGLTPDIWGIHAVAEHCPEVMSRRNESALRVHSYRCGGHYVLTRMIASEADKLNDQEKARLTSWLFEQRQAGNKCPEITTEVISDIKQREKMSISDRADAILLYTRSKIPEFDNIIVYDNLLSMRTLGMGEDQIYQFISRENITYFELLICSECADKHDLTSLMGYLEQKNWIRYLRTERPNELYVYHLTNEGYTRLIKISKIRDNLIIKANQKQKINKDRQGGVGYEDHVMTAEIYDKKNHRKYIPVLTKDSVRESVPPFLSGKRFVNLSDKNYENGYLELKSTLLGKKPTPPPVRRRPPNG